MASAQSIGLVLAAFALLAVACSSGSDPEQVLVADDSPSVEPAPQSDAPSPPEPEPRTAAQQEAPPEPPEPSVDLRDLAERAEAEVILAGAMGPGDAPIVVSDRPLDAGTRFVLGAWAAVVSQRHNLFELSLDLLRDALSGAVDDWAGLGGREQPLSVLLAADRAQALQWSLGVSSLGGAVQLLEADALVAAARTTPGALAFVDLAQLEPGLLPLVVDGWDPLSAPANESPLSGARWIDAGTVSANRVWAEQLGWQEPSELNPLGYVATGDFIPVRCVGRAVRSMVDGDFGEIFALVGTHLRSADVLAVSMEVSATDLRVPTPCDDRQVQLVLQADPAVLDALAEAGVDLVTTAGNHAGDCNAFCPWRDALVDTVSELDARGLAHTGTGSTLAEARSPALVERDGVRLAILSYDSIAPWYWAQETSPGTAPATAEVVAEDVAAARLLADHVIVALSWGEEYVQTTTSGQEAIVDAALNAGASLIVGNHPHTVQPLIERKVERADALVAYALGNFVFDQSWSTQTMQSVLLEVGFSRERLIGYRVRPVVVRRDFQPELVSPRGTEGAQTLERLWRATDQWWSIHDELR